MCQQCQHLFVDQTTTILEKHAAAIRRLEEKVDKLVDTQEVSFRGVAIKDDSSGN